MQTKPLSIVNLPNGDALMVDPRTLETIIVETPRIEDREVKDMIEFYKTSGFGLGIADATIAMLEELLRLRNERVLRR